MNYLKAYCNLIRKAEHRVLPEGYTEKHHIFPKSIYSIMSFDCPGDDWYIGRTLKKLSENPI